jgi:hypothetical protein
VEVCDRYLCALGSFWVLVTVVEHFLTSWRPVSFSRRTLLHGVS